VATLTALLWRCSAPIVCRPTARPLCAGVFSRGSVGISLAPARARNVARVRGLARCNAVDLAMRRGGGGGAQELSQRQVRSLLRVARSSCEPGRRRAIFYGSARLPRGRVVLSTGLDGARPSVLGGAAARARPRRDLRRIRRHRPRARDRGARSVRRRSPCSPGELGDRGLESAPRESLFFFFLHPSSIGYVAPHAYE